MENNMYASYMKEVYGRDTITTDYGFATFGELNGVFVISTMYIKPEFRNSKKGTELANLILAQAEGFTEVVCEIDKRNKLFRDTYNAISSYGFEPVKDMGQYILMYKRI